MARPDPERPSYADILTASQREAFWSRVNKKAPGGCWEWTGALSGMGYGTFSLSMPWPPRRTQRAHRVAWELTRYRVPDDLRLDHICRNKRGDWCVHKPIDAARQH